MADTEPVAAPVADAAGDAPAAEGGAPANARAGKREGRERKERNPDEKPKIVEKPEPVPNPSEEAKNKAIEACKARIASHDKRLADIKNTLDKMQEDRSKKGDSTDGLRAELKELRAKFNSFKERRQSLFTTLSQATEARKEAETKLRDMRKSLKVGSLQEIDKAIADIEYEMSTSTLTLKDEKAKMLEIKQLRASREQVRQVAAVSASVSAMATDIDAQKAMREELKELDQQMTAIRTREKALQEQVEAIKAKNAEKSASSVHPGELLKERKALFANIKEEKDKMYKLEREYQSAAYQFRQYERTMREWKRQQDQIQWEQRKKEREQRKVEREKEREKEKDEDENNFKETPTHPWAAELFACDDLIKFCKKHVPKKEKTSEKKAFDPLATAEKGLLPVGKKSLKEKDEDIFFGGGSKTKKGGAAAAASAAAGGDAAAAVDKKLTLPVDAYTAFITVGVEVPTLASQCQETIQKLQQAKARFQRLTAADKDKAKAEAAAAAAKQKEEAKKAAKARAGASADSAPGVPAAAEVAEPTIDFRKAVRGVKGAHV